MANIKNSARLNQTLTNHSSHCQGNNNNKTFFRVWQKGLTNKKIAITETTEEVSNPAGNLNIIYIIG